MEQVIFLCFASLLTARNLTFFLVMLFSFCPSTYRDLRVFLRWRLRRHRIEEYTLRPLPSFGSCPSLTMMQPAMAVVDDVYSRTEAAAVLVVFRMAAQSISLLTPGRGAYA
jgi:hypothetical protein